MERVPTGIKGFDELIQGGIPKGATVLVSGGAGSGKTILATTFIYEGARKFGEPGLLVTVEDNLKNIVWNMENFGWDIKIWSEEWPGPTAELTFNKLVNQKATV